MTPMKTQKNRVLILTGLVLLVGVMLGAFANLDALTGQPQVLPTQAVLPTTAPDVAQETAAENDFAAAEPALAEEEVVAEEAITTEEEVVELPVEIAADMPSIEEAQVVAVIEEPQNPVAVIEVPQEPVENQVVIRFAASASEVEREAYIAELGGTVQGSIMSLDTVVVQVPASVAETSLPKSDAVAVTEPDYQVTALSDDPLYPQQWALPAINAAAGWQSLDAGSSTVIVAVVDSGICAEHPDLAGRVVAGYDFVEDDEVPQDAYGHGCGVAGVIAANGDNGLGIAGVAPNAQIMPLRVLDASGIGAYSDVAAAIVFAADNGAQVINLSLGGAYPSSVLEDAVNYAAARGVLVIAAAGNTGGSVLFPAAYDAAIAVASVDANLERSSFSSFGEEVDLLAPGRDIYTTHYMGGFNTMTGTSFAAPQVAGIAALELGTGGSLELTGDVVAFNGEYVVVDNPTEEPPVTPEVPSNLPPRYAEMLGKVQANGTIQVIVGFEAPFLPAGELDEAALQAQEARIQTLRANLVASLSAYDVQVLSTEWFIPYVALEVDEEAFVYLLNAPEVTTIEENEAFPPILASSVPVIGADDAWAQGYDGTGQVVAVLDTGVETSHSFLAGKVVSEACYSGSYAQSLCPNGLTSQVGTGAADPSNCSSLSSCSHGTHVSGIAAGDGSSFDGVARDADLIGIQVFSLYTSESDCGVGQAPCLLASWVDIVNGLNRVYALRSSYTIASINISIGGGYFTSSCDTYYSAMTTAVSQLNSVNIATVVASGNNGFTNGVSFPACISGVVSVGATQDNDAVASFSNNASFLDLLAPGVSITSSIIGNNYASWNGTSMATPHVAGAWALLREVDPTATNSEILAALTSTGVLVTDHRTGTNPSTVPRIQVDAAAAALGGSTPTAPANDDFNDAIVINTPEYLNIQSTDGATRATDDPYMGCYIDEAHEHSVWYKYTAPENGELWVSSIGSDYDTVLGVFTGRRGALTSVDCDDDGQGAQSILILQVQRGVTYYIEVAGFGQGDTGTLEFELDFNPFNDDIYDAYEITRMTRYTQITEGAGTDSSDPEFTCVAGQRYHTVWYEYTPTRTGYLGLHTNGSNFDTVLGVWTGTRTNLTNVACNDDGGTGTQSMLRDVVVEAGETYFIEVAGYWEGISYGRLYLTVSFAPPSAPTRVVLSQPRNNTYTNDTTPMLEWLTAVRGYEYEVEVATDSRFNNVVYTDTVIGLSDSTSTLSEGMYYWRVRAISELDAVGAWSAPWRFTVDTTPPDAPILRLPADGSSTTNNRTPFSWLRVPGAVSYEMQLDVVNPPLTTVYASRAVSYRPPTGLLVGTTYYWRARAVDAAGNASAWSDTWTIFFDSPANAVPVRNRYTDSSPTLTWNRVTWATEYEIQIDDAANFRSLEYTTTVGSGYLEHTVGIALPNGVYNWRVRARRPDGRWGTWSVSDTFVIDAP